MTRGFLKNDVVISWCLNINSFEAHVAWYEPSKAHAGIFPAWALFVAGKVNTRQIRAAEARLCWEADHSKRTFSGTAEISSLQSTGGITVKAWRDTFWHWPLLSVDVKTHLREVARAKQKISKWKHKWPFLSFVQCTKGGTDERW